VLLSFMVIWVGMLSKEMRIANVGGTIGLHYFEQEMSGENRAVACLGHGKAERDQERDDARHRGRKAEQCAQSEGHLLGLRGGTGLVAHGGQHPEQQQKNKREPPATGSPGFG